MKPGAAAETTSAGVLVQRGGHRCDGVLLRSRRLQKADVQQGVPVRAEWRKGVASEWDLKLKVSFGEVKKETKEIS